MSNWAETNGLWGFFGETETFDQGASLVEYIHGKSSVYQQPRLLSGALRRTVTNSGSEPGNGFFEIWAVKYLKEPLKNLPYNLR